MSLCVQQGLLTALDTHMYTWHKEVKKQVGGLAIGLDFSRAVGRLVMLEWDQKFLKLARDNQINILCTRGTWTTVLRGWRLSNQD